MVEEKLHLSSNHHIYISNIIGKAFALILLILCLLLIWGCEKKQSVSERNKTIEITAQNDFRGKKIYFLDSYHKDFQSRVLTRNAMEKALNGTGIEIRYEFLDAKNIKEQDELEKSASKIKEKVDQWNPDCIIAADDAINKYLIAPYYKGTDLPVIFIGINWDASEYGYPEKNITGQLEVELFSKMIDFLKQHSSGERVGILTGNTLTDLKNIERYRIILGENLKEVILVDNYNQWKNAFQQIQNQVDILFLRHRAGILGWDQANSADFVEINTKIPTGTVHLEMKDLVVATFPKLDEEYGEYAAETALLILSGTSPADIPITQNTSSKIFLNMYLAKILDIRFSQEEMQIATLIGFEKKKILYVNSYHSGYQWSDEIETGLIKALDVQADIGSNSEFSSSSLDLRIYRMDTKLNQSESFKKSAALSARSLIESWDPDLLIVSDDNAAKYLVSEYYSDSSMPVIFCGVNWDATDYGFPSDNVTGMIEVTPYRALFSELENYADGERLGFLSSNSLSSSKEIDYLKNNLNIRFEREYIVENFKDWKDAYLKAQNDLDMLLIFSEVGIEDWDEEAAASFILENSFIPTGSTLKSTSHLSLISVVRLAEEQGWWSGKRAVEVLNGRKISDIPIAENLETALFLNLVLARQMEIVFPVELLKKAALVD
jgi:ABC-type uncharacterized transport system substrate-binding protein